MNKGLRNAGLPGAPFQGPPSVVSHILLSEGGVSDSEVPSRPGGSLMGAQNRSPQPEDSGRKTLVEQSCVMIKLSLLQMLLMVIKLSAVF